MNRELIREYLEQTAMEPVQAQALSRIFAEMATKTDLAQLDARLTGQMAELDARLTGQMAGLEARLTGQITGRMAELESRLTWRIIAIVGFFATAVSLLNVYVT